VADLGVLGGEGVRGLGGADGLGGDQHHGIEHGGVPGVPAGAGGADAVGGGYTDSFEVDPVLRVGGDRELLGESDAGGRGIHEEEADAGGFACRHDETVGGRGEGHVALDAGQDDVVTVGHGGELDT